MKLTIILTSALLTVANAHSDYNAPKIVGGRKFLSEMKARHAPQGPIDAPAVQFKKRDIVERQTTGRCGPNLGSCTNCCSPAGSVYQSWVAIPYANRLDIAVRVKITVLRQIVNTSMEHSVTRIRSLLEHRLQILLDRN